MVGVALLGSSILTGISPFVAHDNFLPTFIVRVIIGIFGVGHEINNLSLKFSAHNVKLKCLSPPAFSMSMKP